MGNVSIAKPTKSGKSGGAQKRVIVSLIERGGDVKSFHVKQANKENVTALVNQNIDHESDLFTDESRLYHGMNEQFTSHQTVKHTRGEYVRGQVHTNTIENYFSVFKRGMRGTYQHCREKHLHRYLAEFDFRHNNRIAMGHGDIGRADFILEGVVGKRLTYETASAR